MKGLGFSPTKGPSILQSSELYHSRLERLFFTPEGALLGNPDWGSRIPNEFFYEPADLLSANEILNECTFLLTEREPLLTIDELTVNILDGESGNTGVLIKADVFSPPPDEEEITVSFFNVTKV